MLGNACQRVLRAVFVFFLVGELIASMFVVLGLHYVDFLLVIPFRTTNRWLAAFFAVLNIIVGFFFGCLKVAYLLWIAADATPVPDFSVLLRMLSFLLVLLQFSIYICLVKTLRHAS
jgi:hypothetical protein